MNNRKNNSSQPLRNSPSKKDHIPLGIINPPQIQKNTNIKPQHPQLPLQVHSKPFNIKNRTHYQNELQNKDSIPLRLREPRVYVQNIVKRYQKKQLILPSKKAGSNQYQLTVSFFRKIGQSLPQKTKKCLSNLIKQFNNQKKYSKPLQNKIFFTRVQFIEFIIQNFKKFNHQEAQLFWNLGYNQLRFKDRISMEAFVFNFSKFYLQTQNFNNMFSQTALRQRLIDLRVSLIDWANNQIIFKYNMRNIREKSKGIQKYLKIRHSQDAFCDFQMVIQQCQQSHIKLKFLSQFFFNLSDNKNFTQQKVKTSLHSKIQEKFKKLQMSRQVIKSFFQTNDYTQSEYFPITDILQFCKVDRKNEQTISYIISWIQGLFDYLYYNKPEDKQLGLTLNLQTKRLQCANILNVNAKIIKQYDRYLEKQCDDFVKISKQFLFAVDDGLRKMPELQGHKKIIVQCNFMSEIALRFIRFVDLGCFCKIVQVVDACQNQTNIQQVILILSHTYKEQQIKRTMKNLFSLTFNNQTNQLIEETQKESSQSQKNNIEASLKKYNKIKQQPLLLKLKQEKKSVKNENNDDYQSQQIKVTSPKQINSRQNLENILIEEKKVDKQLLIGSSFCPHYYKYNLELSRQTNETISAVQSLQSRLFQLLQFDQ